MEQKPRRMHEMAKYLCVSPSSDQFWDRTCSYGCRHCYGAIFFLGNPIDVPDEFKCPHCGKRSTKS